ncbi:MAG: hypothetical protein LUO80_06595, partial [Methylococcaceae bacterium]|nr:hypothetical protein [Methylococcaceae bacterium]
MRNRLYRGIGRCSAGGWVALALLALPAQAAAPEQSKSWIDRNHFPEAYSILTSDRVMFPDNTTDWPLKID